MRIGTSSWQPGISPHRLLRLEVERPAAHGAKQRAVVVVAAHVEAAEAVIMPTRELQVLRLPQLQLLRPQPQPMRMRQTPLRRDRGRPRPADADVGAPAEAEVVAARPPLLQRLGLQKDHWLRHYNHRKRSGICGRRKAPATR
jgi:hypothetical protein